MARARKPSAHKDVETDPRVRAYVENQGLGVEVAYSIGDHRRRDIPDFILRIDDGRADPLDLVVEVSDHPQSDKDIKAATMQTYWAPGVNQLERFGRWSFAEFTQVFEIDAAFGRLIESFVRNEAA